MEGIHEVFQRNFTRTQATKFFMGKKPEAHAVSMFLFLSAVSEAVGGADYISWISSSNVHPEFKQALTADVDTNRSDSGRQVEELCRFVQLMDSNFSIQAPRELKS